MKVKPLLENCARLIAKAQGERKAILKAIQSGIANKERIVIEEKSEDTGGLIDGCFQELGINYQRLECKNGQYHIQI